MDDSFLERPATTHVEDPTLLWRVGSAERRLDAVEHEQEASRREAADRDKAIASLAATVDAAVDSMRSLRNAVYAATGTAVVITVTALLTGG